MGGRESPHRLRETGFVVEHEQGEDDSSPRFPRPGCSQVQTRVFVVFGTWGCAAFGKWKAAPTTLLQRIQTPRSSLQP